MDGLGASGAGPSPVGPTRGRERSARPAPAGGRARGPPAGGAGARIAVVTRLAARRRAVALPPQVLLLGSIASVQFGAGIAVRLFDQAGPGGVVLMRLLLSGALLWAIARPRLRGRSRAAIAAAVGFGLILGTMNWSFYEALDRLPLGVAVTIEFLGPLVVALAGSRQALDLLWVLLAGVGVALLTLHGDSSRVTLAGVLLALVAAACWAAYILLSQRVGAEFEALDGLAISLAVASLVVLPVGAGPGWRCTAQAGGPRWRSRRGDAVLAHPLLAGDRRAAPAVGVDVRPLDESAAGVRRTGRGDRARAVAHRRDGGGDRHGGARQHRHHRLLAPSGEADAPQGPQ